MKKYAVEIVGVTPYMQHRMDDGDLEKWEKSRGKIIERPDVSRDDLVRAEYHCYRDSKGKIIVPGEHLRQMMISAGAMHKSKVGNAKRSMKNIVAAMVFVTPDEIPFGQDFVIDKRSTVNQNNKARVMVIRPKWTEWKLAFNIIVDNDTITDSMIKDILESAGNYVGLGSFRPECSGMFGRFKVSKFSKVVEG